MYFVVFTMHMKLVYTLTNLNFPTSIPYVP